MALITTKPLSRTESYFLVNWLREKKQVEEKTYDSYYFATFNIPGVIRELAGHGIIVTEKEVLFATRRIMGGRP